MMAAPGGAKTVVLLAALADVVYSFLDTRVADDSSHGVRSRLVRTLVANETSINRSDSSLLSQEKTSSNRSDSSLLSQEKTSVNGNVSLLPSQGKTSVNRNASLLPSQGKASSASLADVGMLGGGGSRAVKPTNVCEDDDAGLGGNCTAVASECDSNPRVRRYCVKTCGLCQATLMRLRMHRNTRADLKGLCYAMVAYTVLAFVMSLIWWSAKDRTPWVYIGNVYRGFAPLDEFPGGMFGWFWASMRMTPERIEECLSLDAAMFIDFHRMCMRLMMFVGSPMLLVLMPLTIYYGDNPSADDPLTYTSIDNLDHDHWLYCVHAFLVWYVVLMVTSCVHEAQNRFLDLRYAWLSTMPAAQARTILVENIPGEFRSDESLKSLFSRMVGEGRVVSAYVVKATHHLRDLVREQTKTLENLDKALADEHMDKAAAFQAELDKFNQLVEAEREKVWTVSDNTAGLNCWDGFVTFDTRIGAALSTSLQCTRNSEELCITCPAPEPMDLIWTDMQHKPETEACRLATGYLLLFLLGTVYLPLVIGISDFASSLRMGPLQSVWQGIAPTLGLTIMVKLLPFAVFFVCEMFFSLNAKTWSQVNLHRWYFWLQILFVILVAAVGRSLTEFIVRIFTSPKGTITMLGEIMPSLTNFYMAFLTSQWLAHVFPLMRHSTLGKCVFFKEVFKYEEEKARDKAEPESQAIYGIGARAARLSIAVTVGLLYCTMQPLSIPILLVCLFISRAVNGYLIAFAEIKKSDSGGAIWVSQMYHLYVALLIFIIVMTSVIHLRSEASWPTWVAGTSAIFVIFQMNHFDSAHAWRRLPVDLLEKAQRYDDRMAELLRKGTPGVKPAKELVYIQPELLPKPPKRNV